MQKHQRMFEIGHATIVDFFSWKIPPAPPVPTLEILSNPVDHTIFSTTTLEREKGIEGREGGRGGKAVQR